MSTAKLDAFKDALAAKKTRALLVIRDDKIVYEWYAEGQEPTKQGTASLAKAIVGGLSLAVAINDGLIKLDDPAWKYVPAWKDDPERSKITRFLTRWFALITNNKDSLDEQSGTEVDCSGDDRQFVRSAIRSPCTGSFSEGGSNGAKSV